MSVVETRLNSPGSVSFEWEPADSMKIPFFSHYILEHRTLDKLVLHISLIDNLNAISPHLKEHPVDLLIYDERGAGLDALKAIELLREDIRALATMWGADFHFPMRRVITILKETSDSTERAFLLGRHHVKDVLVAPRHLARVLRWITKIILGNLALNKRKRAVALSGGGMEGFLYQVGCMHALNQAFSGERLEDCQIFSGVSSGSLCAVALANRIPLDEIIRSIRGDSTVLPKFKSSSVYDIAASEIIKRTMLEMTSWRGLDPNELWQKSPAQFPQVFRASGLERFIMKALEEYGPGTNSFQDLDKELFIGTTTQDTFEHVVMGTKPWDHVPITDATMASCALPPLFLPRKIDDRNFIDGQITRTCNLELLAHHGCNLIIIIDPLTPYISEKRGEVDSLGGLNTVIQTIKSLVSTRFGTALSHITERYPEVDFVVFQPTGECAKAMAGSPMKLKPNFRIIELAYQTTLRRLRERHHVYAEKLGSFDLRMKSEEDILKLERDELAV